MRRPLAVLAPLVAAISLLAACSNDKSATEKACDARANVTKQAQAVRNDLGAGNFGAAKQSAGELRTAVDDYRSTLSALKADVRDQLQPQIDQVKDAVAGLKDVKSPEELKAQLQTVGDALDATLQQAKAALSCPS